jgi:hypothetical protein
MAQCQQQREPAAGGATADKGRQRIELFEERAQILGPNLVLGIAPGKRYAGGAAIAPVVDEDPIAGLGDLLGERGDRGKAAPAARLQGQPKAVLAE